MKMNLQTGFTLIELLVVISIIGLLSSVVLASLSGARGKAADSAIKSSLVSARTQASLFYETTGGGSSYDNVCLAIGGTNNISTLILAAAKNLASSPNIGDDNTDFIPNSNGTSLGSIVCHDVLGSWAAAVSLKSVAGKGWCVDSAGSSKEVTVLSKNDVVKKCP